MSSSLSSTRRPSIASRCATPLDARPIPAGDAGADEGPSIRPGLTGHWRETDNPTEQATLDLYYIRSYSLWMDLHILWARARARLTPWCRPAGRGGVAAERMRRAREAG